jgi:hypothetical protein
MEAIEKFGKGLAKFLALDHHILYCSLRDPLSFLESAFTGKDITVNTSSGRQTVHNQNTKIIPNLTISHFLFFSFFSSILIISSVDDSDQIVKCTKVHDTTKDDASGFFFGSFI